jgi:tRNA pseudouridine55 synthase
MESIKIALDSFQNNEYQQVPPIFSAKKINGQKLYELARKKQIPKEIKPQLVKLKNYRIVSFNNGILKVILTVSKGFYIRSLAHDLGLKLNSCATLLELRRTRSGQFDIKNSVTLEDLLKDNK